MNYKRPANVERTSMLIRMNCVRHDNNATFKPGFARTQYPYFDQRTYKYITTSLQEHNIIAVFKLEMGKSSGRTSRLRRTNWTDKSSQTDKLDGQVVSV